MPAYSQTPLAKKLGIKSGFSIRLINAPKYYKTLFADWPEEVRVETHPSVPSREGKHARGAGNGNDKLDLIHYFVTDAEELAKNMKLLKEEIKPNGIIWISWPKKAAKMQTDITEDVIRDIGLKSGLMDVKVCAVDETWSGLKFVIRLKDRG